MKCVIPKCSAVIGDDWAMCPRHWRMVPEETQKGLLSWFDRATGMLRHTPKNADQRAQFRSALRIYQGFRDEALTAVHVQLELEALRDERERRPPHGGPH